MSALDEVMQAYADRTEEIGKAATDVEFQKIFGTRGVRVVQAASKAGIDAIEESYESLIGASAASMEAKVKSELEKGLPGALAALENMQEFLMLKVGDAIAPATEQILRVGAEALGRFPIETILEPLTRVGDKLTEVLSGEDGEALINNLVDAATKLADLGVDLLVDGIESIVNFLSDQDAINTWIDRLEFAVNLGADFLQLLGAGAGLALDLYGKLSDTLESLIGNYEGGLLIGEAYRIGSDAMIRGTEVAANNAYAALETAIEANNIIGGATAGADGVAGLAGVEGESSNAFTDEAAETASTTMRNLQLAFEPILKSLRDLSAALLPPLLSALGSMGSAISAILIPLGQVVAMAIDAVNNNR